MCFKKGPMCSCTKIKTDLHLVQLFKQLLRCTHTHTHTHTQGLVNEGASDSIAVKAISLLLSDIKATLWQI